jgi:hypothetical protein
MKKLMIAAAASLLTCGACAHAGAGARYAPDVEPQNEPVRVHVTNNYALPVEIYVTGSGMVRRLGLAYPGLPSNFEVPQSMFEGGAEVEFLAQPSGYGRLVRAFPLTLVPGDVVDFVVMTNLLGSHADVALPRLQ